MKFLTIETKKDEHGNAGKGRSFTVTKLAHIVADDLWACGAGDDVRPVWLMLAAPPTTMRPFAMNLRRGSKADVSSSGANSYSRSKPTRFGLLKSAGYLYESQQIADGVEVLTAHLPDLLYQNPGMIDPERCRFLCLTPVWWHQEQLSGLLRDGAQCRAVLAHMRQLTLPRAFSDDELLATVPMAARVASYVESRTRRPIPTDLRFATQLYLLGLKAGIFSLSMTDEAQRVFSHAYHRPVDLANLRANSRDPWLFGRHAWAKTFHEDGTASVGMLPGVACDATHAQLDGFLAQLVTTYYQAL